MSAAHSCKHCRYFECEVMMGDGEPMEFTGQCRRPQHPKAMTEADDWCNQFKPSTWAKLREEQEQEAAK